jgi:cell shape-determining protein MreD
MAHQQLKDHIMLHQERSVIVFAIYLLQILIYDLNAAIDYKSDCWSQSYISETVFILSMAYLCDIMDQIRLYYHKL